jgi:cytochrome P450
MGLRSPVYRRWRYGNADTPGWILSDDDLQTVSALTTFFLVMALYPDVQKKAQADIDRLALNRLPTLDEFNSLPYIRAIIKEIVRWGPVVPLGLPHSVLTDDVYGNYFIPEGTTIHLNVW